MTEYNAEESEARALAGDRKAAVSVLSRSSLKPEVLSALMTDDADDDIRTAVAMRSDATPGQLAWCAQCDNLVLLNRLVAHPKTPVTTVMEIRAKARTREGEAWQMLAESAVRRLDTADPAS